MQLADRSQHWRQRLVLVTGCSGFLGSWLTQSLVELGAEVVGLVRDDVPISNLFLRGIDKRIRIVRGNVEDYWLLERTLNEYEISTVFHLAAQTVVTIANRNPISTFSTNIAGTWNLMEACRRNPTVSSIVVASSDKAYGDHEILPYDEQTPLRGTFPYDVSKSCADLIALSYHRTYNLPVCVTRCGNLYGGGDLNFNRIVPGTIRSVLMNESPIIRSDGSFKRDYVYVLEAVNAYLLLAENMKAMNLYGEAFNFSGETRTVLEVAERIIDLMGRPDLKPIIENRAKGEIKHQFLDAQKAGRTFGWKPLYSLDKGLRDTISWYTEFFQRTSLGIPHA